MKTQTFTQTNALKTLGLFGLFMILTLATNTLMAQTERTVTGIITDDTAPVSSVST